MKTKMTFAATAACLLAASAFAIAASADGYLPTASPTTVSDGDATIEDTTQTESDNGTPLGGRISEDDPDISEGYNVDPVLPTVEILSGAFDGTTFNGMLNVEVTDPTLPLDRIQVQISGSLLLESGETFGIVTYPIEMDNLGFTESTTVSLTADLSEFINQWSAQGVTVTLNDEVKNVASMSPVFQLRVFSSYTDPAQGLTGMGAVGPMGLTLIR